MQMNEGWWKWGRIALYNIVGWGVPFLLMLIPAAAGKLGFEPGSTLYVPQFPFVMANGFLSAALLHLQTITLGV